MKDSKLLDYEPKTLYNSLDCLQHFFLCKGKVEFVYVFISKTLQSPPVQITHRNKNPIK